MSITLKCDDGDLMVSTAGAFIIIDGVQKLAQDIAESLLNNFDPDEPPWYNGSELYLIDEDPATLNTISAEERIRTAVDDAVVRLQDLQDNDAYVDEDELIEEVRELWVQKVGDFTYGFYLYVVSASYEYVPLEFTISLQQQLPPSLDTLDLLSFISPSNQNEPYA